MAPPRVTADVFQAVAEPRRRQILTLLLHGEKPVNDVVLFLQLPQPQVSKHLKILKEVGLVSVRGSGRQRLYRIEPEKLKIVHDWTKTFEQYWTRQLSRIKERAERQAKERIKSHVNPSKEM
jgi:DNA-binding transcriptional ArsR family regulator